MKAKFPDIPFLIVTAVHDVSVAAAAFRHGVYDYLLKPFEREQLIFAVRRALEYRRLKLENRSLPGASREAGENGIRRRYSREIMTQQLQRLFSAHFRMFEIDQFSCCRLLQNLPAESSFQGFRGLCDAVSRRTSHLPYM